MININFLFVMLAHLYKIIYTLINQNSKFVINYNYKMLLIKIVYLSLNQSYKFVIKHAKI